MGNVRVTRPLPAPEWTRAKGLAPASRAALRAIDLHFHDLRHEAETASWKRDARFTTSSEMLGHADVKQSATHLTAERVGLHDSTKRFGTTPS